MRSILVYKQGNEMNWIYLIEGKPVFTLIRHLSGTFLMEYEDMGQAIPDSYGISLIKNWRKDKVPFETIPIGIYKEKMKRLKP